jgi:biopolymer transport protein ExbB
MVDIIIEGINRLGQGGFLMIALLFCSLFVHAIIFERIYNLRKEKLIPSRFISRIYKVLEKDNPQMALSMCESKPGPLTNILKIGIENRDLSEEEIKALIDLAAKPEKRKLNKYMSVLSFMSAVSVLIGLLGTVLGLFLSFSAVFKTVSRPETTAKVASGISIALLTTVAGLAVAIPSIIAHTYFVSKIENIINEMTRHSIAIVRYLTTGDLSRYESEDENDGQDYEKVRND